MFGLSTNESVDPGVGFEEVSHNPLVSLTSCLCDEVVHHVFCLCSIMLEPNKVSI